MSGVMAWGPYGQIGGSGASGGGGYPSDAQIRAQHAILNLQNAVSTPAHAELRERMVRLVADNPSTFDASDTASILAEAERIVRYIQTGADEQATGGAK